MTRLKFLLPVLSLFLVGCFGYGQTVPGSIGEAGEVDIYRFLGSVNDRVLAWVSGSPGDVALEIRNGNGVTQCSSSGPAGSVTAECVVDTAGGSVHVSSSGATDYFFHLQKLNPPVGCSPLAYGAGAGGSATVTACHSFSGSVNDHVRAQVATMLLTAFVKVEIRNANGELKCSSSFASSGGITSTDCVVDTAGGILLVWGFAQLPGPPRILSVSYNISLEKLN